MLQNMQRSLAETLMRTWPAYPKKDNLSLWEIFKQAEYTQASIEEQNSMKLQSAQFRYKYEKEFCFFDQYFPHISSQEFHNRSILDIGCFTGGRLVYWVERYKFGEARGIDINPIFAEAARLFATSKGVDAAFDVGFGEVLPYASNKYDFIVSHDVFEHVQNIERVMDECLRVLKPAGKLLAVFPPFFQPLESHLGLVTNLTMLDYPKTPDRPSPLVEGAKGETPFHPHQTSPIKGGGIMDQNRV